MKKILAPVMAVLAAIWAVAAWAGQNTKDVDAACTAAISAWEEKRDLEGEESRKMQENLALWYNHSLRHDGDESELAEAYWGILNYGGGVMGIIEFPTSDVRLPIYHGKDTGTPGMGHDPESAFPIGGAGNHAVLLGDVDVWENTGIKNLAEGDEFRICILGETLTYRVQEIRAAGRCPENVSWNEEADLCTLMITDGDQWLVIQGVREDITG